MASNPLAVVTGGSSGIGAALARQLAVTGHDLVLVARGATALDGVATEIAATGRAVEVVAADLTTDAGIGEVTAVIDRRRPDVVVNCAGSGWHGPFAEQSTTSLDELIRLDVLALAQISRAAVALMVERGSGSLLNVSSTASFVPGPSVAAYHASKAFVTSLSEAIHAEVAGTAICVTALCPGITPTGFQSRAGTEHGHLPRILVTTAERVAREGLAALARNEAICVPGLANKTIAVLAKLAPRSLVRTLAGKFIARV